MPQSDEHLISGLQQKRDELSGQAMRLRSELARVAAAIESVNHVLETLGRAPEGRNQLRYAAIPSTRPNTQPGPVESIEFLDIMATIKSQLLYH